MDKLQLNLDDLQVNSFNTDQKPEGKGTVHGQDQVTVEFMCTNNMYCGYDDTHDCGGGGGGDETEYCTAQFAGCNTYELRCTDNCR